MNSNILLFIPAYNCAKQLNRVIATLTPEVASQFAEVLVVENCSTDDTLVVAQNALSKINGCTVTLLQNDENYNLGGSHKVAFNYCLDKGYRYLVVLHGDDQGDIHDLLPLIRTGEHMRHDCLLGSRFARGSRLVGYSPFRTFGNRVFNAFISLVTCTRITDMGAGLNMYSSNFLRSRFYMGFPDDLTFNVYMLYYAIYKKSLFKFFPLSWRENDQISNAKIFLQAKHIICLTVKYLFRSKKLFTLLDRHYTYSSMIILRK